MDSPCATAERRRSPAETGRAGGGMWILALLIAGVAIIGIAILTAMQTAKKAPLYGEIAPPKGASHTEEAATNSIDAATSDSTRIGVGSGSIDGSGSSPAPLPKAPTRDELYAKYYDSYAKKYSPPKIGRTGMIHKINGAKFRGVIQSFDTRKAVFYVPGGRHVLVTVKLEELTPQSRAAFTQHHYADFCAKRALAKAKNAGGKH